MNLVSQCPRVSIALHSGFSSRLSEFCPAVFTSPLGILAKLCVASIPVLSRNFTQMELAIQIISRGCHHLQYMDTSSNRDLLELHTCITVCEAKAFLFIMSGWPFVVHQMHWGVTHGPCAPNRTPRQHHRAHEWCWQAQSWAWVKKIQIGLSTNTEPWPYEMHLLAEGCCLLPVSFSLEPSL